ncbi:hypothetical protein [Tessaracoccus coleopterorum]|nr:hypothetical protein [Tessaracoccus coleopterorum]
MNLARGANVTIRGEAKLGRISWPDGETRSMSTWSATDRRGSTSPS